MILNSQPKQFRLQDDGQIFWQQDASNPLPGVQVAQIAKGETMMTPEVTLVESAPLNGQDRDAVTAFIKSWLHVHIAAVLETLVALKKEAVPAGPVAEIAHKLHDALGILPRHDLSAEIAALDTETRRALRQLHVRLGPLLVFIPELNKPAQVHLRALLWRLWNGQDLPAPLPRDGAVSLLVDDPAAVDEAYQQTIGYPVYAGRMIRVDMLDRLVCAIYDSAEGGLFKATHAMAEWLGCSITDLYAVLEAMGHKKESDPADQPQAEMEVEPDAAASSVSVPESPAPAPVPDAVAETVETVDAQEVKQPQVKPELATFRLKRGKAYSAEQTQGPRERKGDKPPHKDQNKFDHKSDRKRPHKSKSKQGRDRKPEQREKKVYSFEAPAGTQGDSPFAMLSQLKVGKKD